MSLAERRIQSGGGSWAGKICRLAACARAIEISYRSRKLIPCSKHKAYAFCAGADPWTFEGMRNCRPEEDFAEVHFAFDLDPSEREACRQICVVHDRHIDDFGHLREVPLPT